MRIAVVGGGISGLGAAWLLSSAHSVDLFEEDSRIGGHACTVDVDIDDTPCPVDIGFMVYNDHTYPNLCALFDILGVEWRETDMSFSVHVDDAGLEWAATGSIGGIFAQPGNVLRPKFLGMMRDITRLSSDAERLVADPTIRDLTLGELLDREGYGEGLREWFLVPMASAIWSTPPGLMLEFPASSFLRFSYNHGLLQRGKDKRWRTVVGGCRTYVERVLEGISGNVYPAHAVRRITRDPGGVRVGLSGGWSDVYDRVVIAAHAPRALQLLTDASAEERELLSAFRYEANPAVLHTDQRFLPTIPRARASWNYWSATGALSEQRISVTYDLSRLQGHRTSSPILFTLNPAFEIDPAKIIDTYEFEHPTFTKAALDAQERLGTIQGVRDTYFAGAWTRYGFHEDGLWSAVQVAHALGVNAPWEDEQTPSAAEESDE
jgi:uncharacterized protein